MAGRQGPIAGIASLNLTGQIPRRSYAQLDRGDRGQSSTGSSLSLNTRHGINLRTSSPIVGNGKHASRPANSKVQSHPATVGLNEPYPPQGLEGKEVTRHHQAIAERVGRSSNTRSSCSGFTAGAPADPDRDNLRLSHSVRVPPSQTGLPPISYA